ncbi:hypothetical protein D051_0887 [Vibrio parahaemolyticus VPCR-2010]|uniref:hypothetical protein n=1 Tax=Vibrio parahaemolyticus TaxID=670 RepID=UPI00038E4FAD|nr:hypothetical protein D051_0887 [Vibrio parahaemolyticus VPCR-2010]
MFESNDHLEQYALNLTKVFHVESHGKISPKKNFVASCLAKAMVGKPEGYNINTLKAELKSKSLSESVQVSTDSSQNHPEILFNEQLMCDLSAFIDTDLFFERLLVAIDKTVEGELDERIYDLLNEDGELFEWCSERLAFTESDTNYYRVYDSMYGDVLTDYINTATENRTYDPEMSFSRYRIMVNKSAYSEVLKDKLFVWLEFLATDFNDELDESFPTEKIRALHELEDGFQDEQGEAINDLLKQHLKTNSASLYVSYN